MTPVLLHEGINVVRLFPCSTAMSWLGSLVVEMGRWLASSNSLGPCGETTRVQIQQLPSASGADSFLLGRAARTSIFKMTGFWKDDPPLDL